MNIASYQKIKMDMITSIKNGELKEGDKITPEIKLAKKYNVSRMTARKAIEELVNTGTLYRIQGKGTFVSNKKFEKKIHDFQSFTEEMKELGYNISNTILEFKKIQPTRDILQNLTVSENDSVFYIKRLRMANDSPMCLEIAYVPEKLAPSLNKDIIESSLFDYLENTMNYQLNYALQVIEAVSADEEMAKLLEIELKDPILLNTVVTRKNNGEPVEYAKSFYRADKYKFIQPAYRLKGE